VIRTWNVRWLAFRPSVRSILLVGRKVGVVDVGGVRRAVQLCLEAAHQADLVIQFLEPTTKRCPRSSPVLPGGVVGVHDNTVER
jgi:hypothetical protein